MSRGHVVLLALAVDLLWGEPPERWHPVVWMGRLVAGLERRAPREGLGRQLAYGAAMEVVSLAVVAAPAALLERLACPDRLAGMLLQALALKPAFAVRALFEASRQVESALGAGDLPRARREVGRIVSRDVEGLDAAGVAAAAVESLAENAGDSVVAPLLFYAAFGLPGAYAYRVANTLDAMVGYRGRYEHLGKVAARLDDLLNLAPSRMAALATAATARLAGGSPAGALRCAVRDSSRTASPNAGWPMAAAAGALDLRLEKVGHYVLNEAGRLPEASDVRRARVLVAAGLAAVVAVILAVGRRRW